MPKLKRYARYLTKDEDQASDLFQETYGRAHSKRHLFNDEYQIEQWLFPIMKNIWINQIKRRQNELLSQSELERDNIQSNVCVAKEIEHRSLLNRVHSVLQNLPQKDQEVLEQIVSFGHSYEEAARSLSVPIGTVMSRLSRARKRLKEKLQLGEEFIFMFIPPVFYSSAEEITDLDNVRSGTDTQSNQKKYGDNLSSASLETSSKRKTLLRRSDLYRFLHKSRQKSTDTNSYDYQLMASFVILGVDGMFESLPSVQDPQELTFINQLLAEETSRDDTTRNEEASSRFNVQERDDNSSHLDLLDDEAEYQLDYAVDEAISNRFLLAEDVPSKENGDQGDGNYSQKWGSIIELLNTQGILDHSDLLNSNLVHSTTDDRDGQDYHSADAKTSIIPLSDILGFSISPVTPDPTTSTAVSPDDYLVITHSGGGTIIETVTDPDPTLLI
ncbi:RNA polymerase sigma factor [Kiloniella antarctica]|uniref:RNA polymerase sigma factor n=1 Tax=Kiloniella antarctica TaxID=1550907 RepID=A0ABW5BL78_9PROT